MLQYKIRHQLAVSHLAEIDPPVACAFLDVFLTDVLCSPTEPPLEVDEDWFFDRSKLITSSLQLLNRKQSAVACAAWGHMLTDCVWLQFGRC